MKTCYTCVYAEVGVSTDWLGNGKKSRFCSRFPPHPHYGPPKVSGVWVCGEHMAKPPELTTEERLADALDLTLKKAFERLKGVDENCRREIAHMQIKLQWATARERES